MRNTLEYPSVVASAERRSSGEASLYSRKHMKKSMKHLAEAMILQSMEDFWNASYRDESIEFFKGEGFNTCARMAGMCREDRTKLLQMVSGVISPENAKKQMEGF
jgi:hypothetical protein